MNCRNVALFYLNKYSTVLKITLNKNIHKNTYLQFSQELLTTPQATL